MLTDRQRQDYLRRARAAAARGETANLTVEEEADLWTRAGLVQTGEREFSGLVAGRWVRLG